MPDPALRKQRLGPPRPAQAGRRRGAQPTRSAWNRRQTLGLVMLSIALATLSLGDSHRGPPVLGTTPDCFSNFLYGHR